MWVAEIGVIAHEAEKQSAISLTHSIQILPPPMHTQTIISNRIAHTFTIVISTYSQSAIVMWADAGDTQLGNQI